MALTVVEWVILRRWTPEKLRREFPETLPVLDRMVADVTARGSGAVAMTAHCGNWELLSILYARFKPGLLVPVAQRVYFEKYNNFIHWLRTSTGLEVFYTDESARRLIRVLQEKKYPAFLPDQDVRTNSGVFVDFFGLPAYTVTFPVALARKFRVPLFIAILVREGKKFKMDYSGLVDVPRTGDESADLLAGTEKWARIMEDMIRKYPEQWAWTHPRWRTSPSHPRVHLHRPSRRERETGA
jgi:KDO2-lipid IV(A) lauroyltransferase